MRCARCDFENIPGQTRCIRCGSILEGGVTQVYPPRMPAWRKPFRDTLRWFREWRVVPEKSPMPHIRQGFDSVVSDGLVGMVLSIVPGLAHLLKGRFREIWLLVVLWLVLLSVGLFLYGSSIGSALIGLALGVHAWIAVQYGLFKEITGLVERVAALLILVVLLTILYLAVPRVVAAGFAGGHVSVTIPASNVETGDYLLVRRIAREDRQFPRGTLVLFHPASLRNNQRDRFVNRGNRMIGQIVGLPGETVEIQHGVFYAVDEQRLDPNAFPVPPWLQDPRHFFTVRVPTDSYFINSGYTIHVHGHAALTSDGVRNACVVTAAEIYGRAFMRWWPLTRRGFIE